MASRIQGGNLGRGLEKCKQHGTMWELPQVFSSRLLTFGPHGDDSWTPTPQIRCFQAADCSRFSRRDSKVVFQSSCSDLGSTLCHAANRLISVQEPVNWLRSSCFFGHNSLPNCCRVDPGIISCCGVILCGERGWQYRLSPPTRYRWHLWVSTTKNVSRHINVSPGGQSHPQLRTTKLQNKNG